MESVCPVFHQTHSPMAAYLNRAFIKTVCIDELQKILESELFLTDSPQYTYEDSWQLQRNRIFETVQNEFSVIVRAFRAQVIKVQSF